MNGQLRLHSAVRIAGRTLSWAVVLLLTCGLGSYCRQASEANRKQSRTAELVRLHQAYINGEEEPDLAFARMRELLQQGADPNARSDRGNPLLWEACTYEAHEEVVLLVQAGAQVNARGEFGTTPLMRVAQRHDNAGTALVLLSNGADPDLQDWEGNTALNLAVRSSVGAFPRSNTAMIRPLLKYGAQADLANKGGFTPLHGVFELTAKEEHVDIVVELLLENGANPLRRSVSGRTPLDEMRLQRWADPETTAMGHRALHLMEIAATRATNATRNARLLDTPSRPPLTKKFRRPVSPHG